ncbi:DUF2975 domain-containing protein [Maritalea mediterranea]|uniref:DUF2975 domain-containing protein n=1 Tax=Maritalea mediterranea TaxID=2909667 RepID=A0ABS9E892_9HYPH|nr:DUF2975 domain-containing protein [Maritalea mediterranea]MCF4097666.1 DUF2975 domain-containing protein [Maritalea mediterranea]
MSPKAVSRLARILSVLLSIAIYVIPIMIALLVLFGDTLKLALLGNQVLDVQADEFTPAIRIVLGVFAAGYLVPLLVGFAGLRQTFREAAAARWLSEASVTGFRRFAWANLAVVCYEIFGGVFLVTYVKLQQVPNQISIIFQVTFDTYSTLFIALAMLVVAHIFAVGQAAHEENQGFV